MFYTVRAPVGHFSGQNQRKQEIGRNRGKEDRDRDTERQRERQRQRGLGASVIQGGGGAFLSGVLQVLSLNKNAKQDAPIQ